MDTKQKNFMGMDQEISKWKTWGLLIFLKIWPEDCGILELSTIPSNPPTLRSFSQVRVTGKVIVWLFNQQK